MRPPEISVILPTFNREHLIGSTIKNVLSQSFNNFELIIVNDCSTDQTDKIIEKYQKKDARIVYVKNKKNLGCSESRNIGLTHAQAESIAFMDDDDQYIDDETLKCLHSQMIHESCDVVIADYKVGNDLKRMDQFGKKFKHNIMKAPGPFLQCVLIKKKLITKIAPAFDSQAIPSEDWDFFISISKLSPVVSYCACTTFNWKLNQDSQSLDFLKEANALTYICKKHKNYITENLNSKIMSHHYRRIARVYEKTGVINQVNFFYKKAFKEYPLSIKNIFYFIMAIIGYGRTKICIEWLRKIRGVPNA
tara:strand:- start:1335 stop:2252 length:918 start_codon:yes stop_codon:yes gene_type:complete